jgi:predicted flap endonuclease-1-like 5' DNA nuclease
MNTTTQPSIYVYLAIAAVVAVLVLFIMRAMSRSKITKLTAAVAHAEGERDALIAERDRLLTDLDTARAQIRPLSDEVDRLKRAEAKRINATAAPDAASVAVSVAELPGSDPDLMQLKGVGDKFAAKLRELGIDSIRQVAGWSSADAAVIDSQLGAFQGRVKRDRLVEQAKLLHEGRITEYETRFGKLGAA